jgi:hypothetical protein
VTVGSGTIAVRAPRVDDKRVDAAGELRKFSSRILPAYARRAPKVGEVIPILYLRGLSTGDFRPALERRLGEDAAGLSATSVSRLCKEWEAHHDRFRQRRLSFSRYAYLYMDGIHVRVRLGEDPKMCLLIVIGVREDGVKKLLAVEDGYASRPRAVPACFAISSAGASTNPARCRRRRLGRVGRAARGVPRRVTRQAAESARLLRSTAAGARPTCPARSSSISRASLRSAFWVFASIRWRLRVVSASDSPCCSARS